MLLGWAAVAAEPAYSVRAVEAVPFDGDIRDGVYVERAGPLERGQAFASARWGSAFRPSPGTQLSGSWHELVLQAGGTLHERLRIDVVLPVVLATGGREPGGPTLGDARFRAMVPIVTTERRVGGGGGPGLGVVAWLDAPSGRGDRYLGRGVAAPGAKVAASWEGKRLSLGLDAGVQAGSGRARLPNDLLGDGPSVMGLGGLSVAVTPTQDLGFVAELSGRTLSDGLGAEVLLSARSNGVSVGIGSGFGSPEVPRVRLTLAGSFVTRARSGTIDQDVEGTLRVRDLCPLENETVNGFKDDDGCPDALGTLSIDLRYGGTSVPGSVVLSNAGVEQTLEVPAEGASLDVASGTYWTGAATGLCLRANASGRASTSGTPLVFDMQPRRDRNVVVDVRSPDGVGVPATLRFDGASACVPSGPVTLPIGGRVRVGEGTHTASVEADGFAPGTLELTDDLDSVVVELEPAAVLVEGSTLVLPGNIGFNGPRLTAESFDVLDAVARTVRTLDGTIRVVAHTDNLGTESSNQVLSEQRAAAVVGYLVGKGVDARRLKAIGVGELMPVDTNRTPRGRARNARIEFLLEAP